MQHKPRTRSTTISIEGCPAYYRRLSMLFKSLFTPSNSLSAAFDGLSTDTYLEGYLEPADDKLALDL